MRCKIALTPFSSTMRFRLLGRHPRRIVQSRLALRDRLLFHFFRHHIYLPLCRHGPVLLEDDL